MSHAISCPKCGRPHSLEEYEKDRFCRDCGTLLLKRAQAIRKEEGEGWKALFPYTPYPQQVKLIGDVGRIVGGGGVLIAEACNGFGKTISVLSSLLSLGRSIVYATRTHEQVRQVLSEVSAINKKSGDSFTAVNLASRQHLCLNPECRKLPRREALEVCRTLREERKCPYRSEISSLPPKLPPVLSTQTLMRIGRSNHVCPYYLARRAIRQSRIVVAPYVYIFESAIRESIRLDLSGKVLVLDEGHNLDKVGQEVLSDSLSERSLDMASQELRSIGKSTIHMQRLADHIRGYTSNTPLLRSGEELKRDLELTFDLDLHEFINFYEEAVEAIRALKLQHGETPVCYLNGVLSFISLVVTSRKDRYVAIYQRNPYGVDLLEYRCLDPSLAIQPVVEETNGTLIMSGTLSPLDLFAEVVGLSHAERDAYPSIQSPENVCMVIDARVTTRFRERSEEMILEIGRIIAEEVVEVPNGVLLFFPQRGFMSRCLDLWGENGIIQVRSRRLHLGGKSLFVEGKDALDNRGVVERYKRAASSPKGAVLCCVFRGRNSEGSNFPGREARGIFTIGVPYANYSDPLIRAQINYFNRRSPGLGYRWYTMDAFRAANQALGRGIRGKDDWCHYWMLDSRYAEHLDLISKWAIGEKPEFRGIKSPEA